MKKFLSVLVPLALPLSAQLKITEIMSDSAHSTTGAGGDWFEITNTGSSAVNVGGLSFDDESALIGASGPLPSYLLQAGASLIVLEDLSSEPFRSLWNIAPSVRIITRSEISNYPGLSSNGDALFLFSGTGAGSTAVDSFIFGEAREGVTFARYNDGSNVPGGLSVDGVLSAYRSDDPISDVASPGLSIDVPAPAPPFFARPYKTASIAGASINSSDFRVTSFDPNPGDTMTLTLSGAPAWLGLTATANGVARFTGTPPAGQTGPVVFDIVSTDNTGRSATQAYQIDLLPASSPIILNEYNGVDPQDFLGGGAADDPGAPSDTYFGRIEGNGGAWVEFVVTQPLDLRGWTLEIESTGLLRRLKFSDHPALAEIPAGTILTMTESNQRIATQFNIIPIFDLSGWGWSNIWMHDPFLIDQEESLHPATAAIGSNDTRFTWLDDADVLVYGPSGESIARRDTNTNGVGDELIGVSGTEVFRLQANPLSTATPLNINYNDANNSTFGRPNQWNNNAAIQFFTPYVNSNNPPTFGPVSQVKAVRGAYSVSVEAPGFPVTVEAAPDFLTINTSGPNITITNNRPLTPTDIGTYEVTLRSENTAASSNDVGYLVYELEVLHPAPPVLLNEYNAVAADRFLNGGSLSLDGDGLPNATDSHFGRVLGNGGNWFEIVVVGNNAPGSVDLRGWTIDVGQIAASGKFVGQTTVTMNEVTSWAAIPNGTILTFTGKNTANGGLDTELNRVNRLTTDGYAWSNVFLETPSLVTVDNPTEFRTNSSNSAFVIRDASGTVIFGPAGEGVAPLEGVGNTDVFELENDPSTLISPIDEATNSTLGYDDGSSGSTFGSPNLFAPIGSTTDRAQNFTAFIPAASAFNDFLADNGLAGAPAAADSDLDGFSNFDEYIFGGNPADGGSFPTQEFDAETGTLTMNVRTSDPLYLVTAQQSTNLQTWQSTDLTVDDAASPLGGDFVLRSVTYTGSEPKVFLRLATTEAP